MNAKLNGPGFSEEHAPYEAQVSKITSRKTRGNARELFNLTDKEMAQVRVAHLQFQAYFAVLALWRRRHAEGMSKKDLADKLERDPAWVSRALAGPKNWTMRTLGELTEALGGHVEIKVAAVEDQIAAQKAAEAAAKDG